MATIVPTVGNGAQFGNNFFGVGCVEFKKKTSPVKICLFSMNKLFKDHEYLHEALSNKKKEVP